MNWLTSCFTDIGQRRPRNEDAVLAVVLPASNGPPPAALLGVADGMGGSYGGDVASRITVETLQRELSSRSQQGLAGEEEWIAALRAVFACCARNLAEMAAREVELSQMGTTLTCAVVDGHQVRYGHVGDSRAYLARNGEFRRLTTDHTAANELALEGKIKFEDIPAHRGRSVLTRWLGPGCAGPEPEIGSFAALDGDVLLLCSDGLSNMVEESQIQELIEAQPRPLDQAALENLSDRLIHRANAAGGKDNISVVLGLCLGG